MHLLQCCIAVQIFYAAAVYIRLRGSFVWQGSAHTSLGPTVTLCDCTEWVYCTTVHNSLAGTKSGWICKFMNTVFSYNLKKYQTFSFAGILTFNISKSLWTSTSGKEIGPSGVRALPLAAGINEGGHCFRYFGPSVLRAPAEQTKVATVLGN